MFNHNSNACPPWESWTSTLRTMYNMLQVQFPNNPAYPGDPWGVRANACWPSTLTNDPGFALFPEDPWYDSHQQLRRSGRASYHTTSAFAVTNGKVNQPGWNRRRERRADDEEDLLLDPDELVVVGGNQSRRITAEELREHYGILKCSDPECLAEQEAAGVQSALTLLPAKTSVPTAPAEATPVVVADASGRPEGRAE